VNVHFLVQVVITILVVGFAFWLLGFAPIDETFKRVAKGIVIFVGVIWLILKLVAILHV
jgi:hypothetical protein